MGEPPKLTTRTSDPRAFSRIIRAALRRRLAHLPLDRQPESGITHQLHVILEGEGGRAVWILAEPAGAVAGGLQALRLQPRSSTQAAQLYALSHLGGASSSFPPDDSPPSARADSQAPAIATSGVASEHPLPQAPPPRESWAARGFAAPLLPRESLAAQPRVLAGRYRLESVLGSGAAGSVHKGHDLKLDRPVAIKVLHSANLANAQMVHRFKAEARAASRLDHVNITGVLDFGQEPGGELYLVLEYVPGQTLASLLATMGALPLSRASAIAAQVASALAHAHQEGIVHRDVKPDNIMLLAGTDADPRRADLVKVCDFGVAKLMDPDPENLTVVGHIFGSPPYMSPQQAGGERIDWRSDLYSLGVTLYEMTTGRLPFEGATLVELIYKHASVPPTPPSTFVPGFDPSLESLILGLLAKDPARRPQSTRALRTELRRIADALAR